MKKCGVQKLPACDKWLSSLVPDIGAAVVLNALIGRRAWKAFIAVSPIFKPVC